MNGIEILRESRTAENLKKVVFNAVGVYISPKGRVDPRHSGITKKLLSQQGFEMTAVSDIDPSI